MIMVPADLAAIPTPTYHAHRTRYEDTFPGPCRDRAREEVRAVPCHPALTRYLHWHIQEFSVTPDGRLFRGARGGDLSESVYTRVWRCARLLAFTPSIANSTLARHPYDLRHACLSTWLNGGAEPTQVAEWAGHSVDVLLRVYAKCIAGRDQINRRRIEEAFRDDWDHEALSDAQMQAGEELRKAFARFDRETILGILHDLLAEGSGGEN